MVLGFFNKKKHTETTETKEVVTATEAIATEETSEDTPSSSNWFSRLGKGLSKSSHKISHGITDIFTKSKLDDEALEQLEELLIMSDFGVKCTTNIISTLTKSRYDKAITPEEIKQYLATEISNILHPVTKPLTINKAHHPHVILVAGVNGNGKTTTIGKLAHNYQQQGYKVMMAACDTFRAAAVEQLVRWADRIACPIVTGKTEADPASVAYQAVERAKDESYDVLLIDTAGRLHNKHNLMEELAKIIRIIQKLLPEAPHDKVLVLDATTGQNAHSQAKAFKEIIDISGLIVTKLDGTAKGGVIVSLAEQFQLPIHAIGVGESVEDLKAFNADDFARQLVGV